MPRSTQSQPRDPLLRDPDYAQAARRATARQHLHDVQERIRVDRQTPQGPRAQTSAERTRTWRARQTLREAGDG